MKKGYVKIADFGFAKELVNVNEAIFSNVGSPLYSAPQILENKEYTSKCDIWSLGILIYEMLYGKTPWIGDSIKRLLANMSEQRYPEFPKT